MAFLSSHRLLFTEASRETVMYSTRIFSDIIECLTHRSSAVRMKAEQMSEIGKFNFMLKLLFSMITTHVSHSTGV